MREKLVCKIGQSSKGIDYLILLGNQCYIVEIAGKRIYCDTYYECINEIEAFNLESFDK